MSSILSMAQYFCLAISVGLSLFSIIVDPKYVGAGFTKLLNNLNIGSLVILLMVSPWKMYIAPVVVAVIFLAVAPMFAEEEKKKRYFIFYAVPVAAILWSIGIFLNFSLSVDALYLFSGMLYLGIITYAMILGHWYLVVFNLSENHLKKAMVVFWALFIFKIALSAGLVLMNPKFLTFGTNAAMGYSFNWVMLLMRYIWGYIIIGVMGYYTWRLTKMRSIQSATGVLYVMTFFVFIGELIAAYYHLNYGISL